MPSGSKLAASRSTSLVESVTSLSSPPMIAARATARSPSVIRRSAGSTERSVPSSVRTSSPARAWRTTILPSGELRAVERVQRASPDVHDVVRHVDDVRDRAHVGEMQPRAQPLRRRADRDLPEDARDVARARVEVVDRDVHVFRLDDRRILGAGRMQLSAEQRRDLAREPDHREQVDAIHGRCHVEDLLADREHVDERRPRLDPVGQQHDPRVILPEADLVLGEDHPARRLTAQLALVEGLIEDREVRAGQRDGDRRARLEVPGTADDLSRVPLPHVDLADTQPVGVRMRPDLEDAPDEEASDVAVRVGDADVDHALDLERRDREPLSDLVGRARRR